jgi:hypothetical protein
VTLTQGWYPDPNDQSRMRFWTGSTWQGERYWNGTGWVDRTEVTGGTSGPPMGPVAQPNTHSAAVPPTSTMPPIATVPPTTSVPPVNLASVQGQLNSLRVRMTGTSWFLFAGAIVVAISSFFPWVTGTISDGLGDSYTETEGLSGAGRFIVIAIGVAIIALGWPVLSSTGLSRKRTVGLTVVVGIMTLLAILFSASASTAGNTSGLSNPDPGFGTLLCWVALIAVWIGLIRVWIKGRRHAVSP